MNQPPGLSAGNTPRSSHFCDEEVQTLSHGPRFWFSMMLHNAGSLFSPQLISFHALCILWQQPHSLYFSFWKQAGSAALQSPCTEVVVFQQFLSHLEKGAFSSSLWPRWKGLPKTDYFSETSPTLPNTPALYLCGSTDHLLKLLGNAFPHFLAHVALNAYKNASHEGVTPPPAMQP